MKIKELVRYVDVQEDGYGIEIEVEGTNLPYLDNAWWKTHEDGSLRGEAHEYVTAGAITFENISKALKSLNNSFRRKESVLNLSFRTSVHVHMNVRELEVEKLGSILFLYYIFEELLMKYCGRERIGNRFCLRLRDSEDIIQNLINAFRDDFRRLDQAQLKYSALNIAPIRSFGSIEFRAMRGTVDTETLLTWVGLLNCLKLSRFESAANVQDFIDLHGIEVLAIEVFGDMFQMIEYEGWKQDVARNASLAIELPYRLKQIRPEVAPVFYGDLKNPDPLGDVLRALVGGQIPQPPRVNPVRADINAFLDELEQEER